MIHTFQCPNCRASLDYEADSHEVTIRCDYCNTTVIVPESLRTARPKPGVHYAGAGEQTAVLSEVHQLLQKGQKIAAIKLFREKFHVGLKEAKDVVEALERKETIQVGSMTVEGSHLNVQAGQAASSSSGNAGRLVSCLILIVIGISALTFAFLVFGGSLAFLGITKAETIISTAESELGINNPIGATLIPQSTATPAFANVSLQFGGEEGVGPGFFNDTRQIGVDAAGNIYTGDYSGGRIQVFDETGKFLTQWNAGAEIYMTGMAVDRQGTVYIIDRQTVNRYDGLTGTAQPPLPASGTNFRSVATGPDGSVVVFAADRLMRFDAQGTPTLDVALQPAIAVTYGGAAVDGAGNIYLLGSDAIHVFAADGTFLNRVGSRGDAVDQFRTSPSAVAVDGRGRLFVADFKGILIFDNNGRYLDTLDFRGVAFDMVFNDQNELLLMNRNGNQVLKYVLND